MSPITRGLNPNSKEFIPYTPSTNLAQAPSYKSTNIKTKNIALKIMTYNICKPIFFQNSYSLYPSSLQHLDWFQRKDRVLKLIMDEAPDVLCLQEARDDENNPILADLWATLGKKGYKIIHVDHGFDPQTEINIIAYKASKLALTDRFNWWAPETANGWPNVTLMAKFYPITTTKIRGKKTFCPDKKADPIYVVNVHNSIDHKEKLATSKNTIEKIAKYINEKEKAHLFFCGDFNSFPDNNWDKEELKILEDNGFVEVSTPLKTKKEHSEISVSGTFIGYSCDPHPLCNDRFGSKLDHIFYKYLPGSANPTIQTPKQYQFNCYVNAGKYNGLEEIKAEQESDYLTKHPDGTENKEIPPRDHFPSDHLPVIVEAIPLN